jgi:hypothetical protein
VTNRGLIRVRFAFDPEVAAVARAVDFHGFVPFASQAQPSFHRRLPASWTADWVAMVTCPAYFGDSSLQKMKVPQMPLTRLNDSAFDTQLEGVYFGMWNGSNSVRCFVSHEALTDKAQGSGQAESLDVFHEYRSEIENLASTKYDAGKITSDGLVVIDSPDLNPEQFQQGLA